MFQHARIVLDDWQIVMHSPDTFAPVGVLHTVAVHTEPKHLTEASDQFVNATSGTAAARGAQQIAAGASQATAHQSQASARAEPATVWPCTADKVCHAVTGMQIKSTQQQQQTEVQPSVTHDHLPAAASIGQACIAQSYDAATPGQSSAVQVPDSYVGTDMVSNPWLVTQQQQQQRTNSSNTAAVKLRWLTEAKLDKSSQHVLATCTPVIDASSMAGGTSADGRRGVSTSTSAADNPPAPLAGSAVRNPDATDSPSAGDTAAALDAALSAISTSE